MSRYLLVFILFFSVQSFSEVHAQSNVKAIRTTEPPIIDGKLEKIWEKAELINDFYQREPVEGKEISERTEFLVLYDNENLYIAARCFHRDPEDIISRELARDVNLGYEDRIQIILDTYLDGRNGYWFQIGPRGSIGDALVSENGRAFNKSWDGIWDGKTLIHNRGWNAEIVIPFKTIGFKKEQSTWGMKLIRNIKSNSESSYWPATSLDAERFQISDAGRLTGLKDISQGLGLDIVPYVTSGVSKSRKNEASTLLDGGLDAFYQFTPSLKAAVTINTDFAQTETDARQINLTRFSLFFPEKRDFFLDGANYFNFGITGDRRNPQANRLIPFFSRTIGLDPNGNPVPIDYGGKFIGQAGDWNIGMLHIKDQNEWDNPAYSVARLSRNIGKQSYIGALVTDGNALADHRNTLTGMDLQLATSEFRETKTIVYNLYGLKSFTPEREGNEFSFGTEINYPNDFLEFRLGYMQIGDDFVSGLGFVPRKNIRNLYGEFELGPRPQKFGILKINTGVDFYRISDLIDGELESSEIGLRLFNIDFLSGDEIRLNYEIQYERLEENFNIIDEVIIPADSYWFKELELQIGSARRRMFWAETEVGHGGFYDGNRTDWTLETGYQIVPPVFIGLESERIWIDLPQDNFITQIFRFNLNFLFSPKLTWYNFAQYDNQTESLGIQSRFQWIIKPGKEIFLVWNSPFISDPLSRFRVEEYEARFKVKYAIRF